MNTPDPLPHDEADEGPIILPFPKRIRWTQREIVELILRVVQEKFPERWEEEDDDLPPSAS